MKAGTYFTLLFVVAVSACHKSDVDIAALNTNPFDPVYSGPNVLFTIDTIATVLYGGSIYEHNVIVDVHTGNFPSPAEHEVWLIKNGGADTVRYYSTLEPDDRFVLRAFDVELGTEYCYRVELRVYNGGTIGEDRCAMAEL